MQPQRPRTWRVKQHDEVIAILAELSSVTLGGIAALSAAFLWSISAIFYERLSHSVRPLEMNLIKDILAVVLFLITLALSGELALQIQPLALVLLLLSGAVGIGLGDTVYFEGLHRLGVRRMLLLSVLAPGMTALLALVFLNEQLPWNGWVGIALTVAGVAWVLTERTSAEEKVVDLKWGVFYGFLAALAQSGGAVLSRLAFNETSVTPLQSSLLRLTAGMAVMVVWFIAFRRPVGQWLGKKGSGKLVVYVLLGVLLGSYLGIWLMQASFKLAPVALAQTLTATSPIFGLPIALISGEKLSPRAVFGVLIAMGGVALIFMGG